MDRTELQQLVGAALVPPPPPAAGPDVGAVDRGDRVAGALLGCALGDALGAPNEGKAPDGRVPIEAWDLARATVTDDTDLTLELAANLAGGGPVDPERFAAQLVDWLPRAVGIGRATREAVLRLRDGVPWHRAGTPSAGNGAAMRVAPVGLAHAGDLDRLRLDAAVSALPTHRHPTAVASAVAMAYATAWCAGRPPSAVDAAGLLGDLDVVLADLHDPGVEPRQPGIPGPVSIRSVVADVGGRLDDPPEVFFTERWSGALVTESLPAALWCVLRSPDDPLEAIRPAAELARDADTVAAMAGALAGALHGARALPTVWVDRLPRPVRHRIDDAAEGLVG